MKKAAVGFLLCILFFQSAQAQIAQEADQFLKIYNSFYHPVYTQVNEAYWKASTDVTDEHMGERIGAEKVAASVWGNRYVLDTVRRLLKHKQELKPIVVRQLNQVLRAAARYPATIPDVVQALVEAEAKQSDVQDGFGFCLHRSGEKCKKPITPNQIDDVLRTEKDLKKRLQYWEASKEVGKPLKSGLITLRDLRNRVSKEMGFTSYFDFEVSEYDMKVSEMQSMLDRALTDMQPLYQQLHCFAKNELAKRFGKPVPKKIPAHWLGNRWGQSWPGLVEATDFDALFKGRSKEWIVEQAEKFYMALGFPKLPPDFWKKSDLYALAPDAKRKKNTHASAWHIDLNQDVRSLMSVEPDWWWFGTAHHELGHIYYYLSYSRPEVPILLRDGANRAFHEAIGDLIFIASTQLSYLRKIGVLPADQKVDETKWLLAEALDEAPVFLPFSIGTMTGFEHDLYEKNLSAADLNSRWWELASKYQGIEPPAARPDDTCDACTKSHVNDDPAQYYDYALAMLTKHQLHDHICTKILKKDVHHCDYTEDKRVGDYLKGILKLGATKDWRKLIQEATGEPLGSRAIVEYYKPAYEQLKKENAGRDCSY